MFYEIVFQVIFKFIMRIFFETAYIISSKGRNIETGSLERGFMGIIAVGRNCEILPSLFQRACISDHVVI
jgi:hypothetical protein